MRLNVLYDNYPHQEGLETAWGFSCVIRGTEKTILFDTGADGRTLFVNMKACGITPEEIDAIVISHAHWDHQGGIYNALDATRQVPLYLPHSFSPIFKEDVKRYGGEVVEVRSPLKICDGVYSSGDLAGKIREQALILQTERGTIILTGCAHPGIVNIIRKAQEVVQGEVLLVVGGFHLMKEKKNAIEAIVAEFKNLGVRYVAPSHCSGDLAKQLFEEAYQEQYLRIGTGAVIETESLA